MTNPLTSNTGLVVTVITTMLVPVLHIVALSISDQDAVATPISALSRWEWGVIHSVGLLLFAVAHITLAMALGAEGTGRLFALARGLLVASAVMLIYCTWYFATANEEMLRGPDANDPLSVLASLVGVVMGCLQLELRRRASWLGIYNAACLAVWLLLVPVILLVDASWLGAYERIVGAVYVAWVLGVAGGLLREDLAVRGFWPR